MKFNLLRLVSLSIALAVLSLVAFGQVSSFTSLTGTVTDPNGAVVPGASVTVKNNDTGIELKVTSASNGTFSVPSLPAGNYTVVVSAAGFKQSIVSDIKLDAGAPGTVKVSLEVGAQTESVTVQGGGEVVQTQSANVATTLQAKQIAQLPLVSRNALDFTILLPGVNTPRAPRDSSINGLPETAYNITIDGVNTQDSNNKTGDGFFSYVNPRLDAIEEVTISTATPGAESAGQGAIQIKFVTRSGNNQYHGSLYEYHRNTALNSNYWFSNRNLAPVHDETHLVCGSALQANDPAKCHAPRNRVLLNQFGGRIGGPISLPKKLFGPLGFDGHDKAFFFVNFEEFRLPQSITRDRTILTPAAQSGIYSYNVTVNGVITTRTVNLLALAAANGQVSTVDPMIGQLLTDIRNSTTPAGITALTDPNQQRFSFLSGSTQSRYFPTTRLDFNLTSKHHLEGSWNYNYYAGTPDLLNNLDSTFPGFPNFGGQGSNRFSVSTTLRSTLRANVVNEARFGFNGGTVLFAPEINSGNFVGSVANQGGFTLNMNNAIGITNATSSTAPSRRNAPVKLLSDTVTWTRGAHSFSFGGSYTQINSWLFNQTVVPTITFGVNNADPASALFVAGNFQGATAANITAASNLYAVLTGRVIGIAGNAILNETTNRYTYQGPQIRRGQMREWGFFGQDSWRARPNLTLNYGLRYELQMPFTPLNDVYSNVSVDDLWGISGPGNLFKPGTMTGRTTQFVQYKRGDNAYNTDKNNFAPSFGFAWSVNAKNGWLKRIFGDSGQTVLRGGYSIAFNTQGMDSFSAVFTTNPGVSVSATRSIAVGNLVTNQGTDRLPVLLRETNRLGPAPFASTPTYPLTGVITNQAVTFDPHIQVPYTQSWSFGIQRELSKDMAVEVRYVGNLNLQQWADYDLNDNESNIFENGFLNEFKLAQANLAANNAAGGTRAGSFAYFGAGTGTVPLPLTLAYVAGIGAAGAGTASNYSNASTSLFRNATLLGNLARNNPAALTFVENLWGDATRRQNAINAGLAANFVQTNPTLAGAIFRGNGGYSRYDAMQVEFRRRLSKGLLVGANYTWAKNFNGTRASALRQPRYNAPGGVLRHAFKANWQYELPIGKGKMLLGSPSGFAGGLLDKVVGGWEFQGTARIQTGEFFNFGGTQLVGMTAKELQKNFKLRFDDAAKIVYILPQDIIDNTRRAFGVSATDPTGYGSLGVPTGRYIAPADGGATNCYQVIPGDCAPRDLLVQGPGFTRFDLSMIKRVKFNERANVEFRAEFLNAFNYVNFFGSVGTIGNATWGQVTAGYQDINNTQDPGGRLIQFVLRINF